MLLRVHPGASRQTAADWQAGRDPQLEAALRILLEDLDAASAGGGR